MNKRKFFYLLSFWAGIVFFIFLMFKDGVPSTIKMGYMLSFVFALTTPRLAGLGRSVFTRQFMQYIPLLGIVGTGFATAEIASDMDVLIMGLAIWIGGAHGTLVIALEKRAYKNTRVQDRV
ncbi:MAG: hypothetical protein CMF12_12290 [Idiomarina sp.]|uniref:hypothetical protein n=1 Tax=Idiomarina sp. TaxID=1874361 RepID=UPI000C5ADA37|nr:hypothetical protein [Idiomarina sp.]MBT43294.1 hypothetical protein [Idiomarina sp.]